MSSESKAFRNFLTYVYKQAATQVNAVYIDVASMTTPSINSEHHYYRCTVANTCVYRPLFSTRRMLQRMYIAAQQVNPDFKMFLHGLDVPASSATYATSVATGEAINHTFKAEHFTLNNAKNDVTAYVPDYTTLPQDFIALETAPLWNVQRTIMPMVNKFNNEDLLEDNPTLFNYYSRTFLAKVMLEPGALIMPTRLSKSVLTNLLQSQQFIDWFKDTEYLSREEVRTYFSLRSNHVEAAAFINPKSNKAWVTLSNFTDVPRTVQIKPLNVLGIEKKVNLGHTVSIRDGLNFDDITTAPRTERQTIIIPPNDVRIVLYEPAG
jgi:hypothetical protein